MMLSDVWLMMSVMYIWLADGVCGRPAGWHVLADQARLGWPALPLQARVWGILWRPPAYILFLLRRVDILAYRAVLIAYWLTLARACVDTLL